MEFLGPILAKLHEMPPTSSPFPVVHDGPSAGPGGGGKNVLWSMKAWSEKSRLGDLPMVDTGNGRPCKVPGDLVMTQFVYVTQHIQWRPFIARFIIANIL